MVYSRSDEVPDEHRSSEDERRKKTASRNIFRGRIKTIVSFYILECYVKTRRYLIRDQ